jgi:hypothetical protein
MKQPDSMIFGSNGKGTSFSSRKKLVPAKIIDVDGLSTFHLSLRCGFSKNIFKITMFKKTIRKKKQMVPQMVPLWLDILIMTCTPLYSYGPKNRRSAGRL